MILYGKSEVFRCGSLSDFFFTVLHVACVYYFYVYLPSLFPNTHMPTFTHTFLNVHTVNCSMRLKKFKKDFFFPIQDILPQTMTSFLKHFFTSCISISLLLGFFAYKIFSSGTRLSSYHELPHRQW